MTHTDKLAEARAISTRIRQQLLQLEDVMQRAADIRGIAYLDSLNRAFDHAESAVLHAVQTAIPVRTK